MLSSGGNAAKAVEWRGTFVWLPGGNGGGGNDALSITSSLIARCCFRLALASCRRDLRFVSLTLAFFAFFAAVFSSFFMAFNAFAAVPDKQREREQECGIGWTHRMA